MSRIDDLVTELCPEGVQFRRLGEVVKIRNGRDYKHLDLGSVPVYGSGGIMTYVEGAIAPGPAVLIPRKGSLSNLFYVEGPFWTVDTIFHTEVSSALLVKFFFYFLETRHLEDLNQAGGIPSLTQSVLNEVLVPVPPVEVQREIVSILDAFTELEAELEAELKARKAQYGYYQNELVLGADSENAEWIALKDLGTWYGGGTPSKAVAEYWEDGTIPWLSPKDMESDVVTTTQDHVSAVALERTPLKPVPRGAIAFVVRSNILRRRLPIALVPISVTLNQDMRALVPKTGILPEYVAHAAWANRDRLLNETGRTDGSMAAIESKKLMAFRIPVPKLHRQKEIVDALDAFAALTGDNSIGIPAELAARRKQYRYYRDRLLTFEEAPA